MGNGLPVNLATRKWTLTLWSNERALSQHVERLRLKKCWFRLTNHCFTGSSSWVSQSLSRNKSIEEKPSDPSVEMSYTAQLGALVDILPCNWYHNRKWSAKSIWFLAGYFWCANQYWGYCAGKEWAESHLNTMAGVRLPAGKRLPCLKNRILNVGWTPR